nr:hypothetical protein CFP56_75278 [Quercus suber]
MAKVRLSKESKSRIKVPWSKALIVKMYGRSIGFHHLTFKINALRKLLEKMDYVNLGRGFFLIRFSSSDDYDKVLRGGPWFIGGHFLPVKPWEPYFKDYEAKLTLVAVWERLPDLPIEFYDTSVLKEIGSVIRLVLRIYSYTAFEARGGYARLCVQVDLEKPLINSIRENCSYYVKHIVKEGDGQVSPKDNETREEAQSDPKYGPWMVVTRRKRANRIGRTSGLTKTNQAAQMKTKDSLDISQTHALETVGENLKKSNPSDLAYSRTEITRVRVCPVCKCQDETVVHLLRDYGIAREFWRKMDVPPSLISSFTENFDSWLKMNCLSTVGHKCAIP